MEIKAFLDTNATRTTTLEIFNDGLRVMSISNTNMEQQITTNFYENNIQEVIHHSIIKRILPFGKKPSSSKI